MLNLLAFDYGASSGRAILGKYDGNRLKLCEVHRFSNDPVMVNGTLYWDVLRLFYDMKQGILKLRHGENIEIASIGTDTWGVDFGLLGSKGELLGNPVHYRDDRTSNMLQEAFKLVTKEEIYKCTGIQFTKFNTIYQLLALKLGNAHILDEARTLLFMPDLLNYFLTGIKKTEYSIASTSQMLNAKSGSWDEELLGKIGLPFDILTDIMQPGQIMGTISKLLCEELVINEIPVVSVAEHDTASAVMAVPSINGKYAYLSSGTWSLLGTEVSAPLINEKSFRLEYTNEGGFGNTIRLLKNIMGLWIFQECKRTWDKTGEKLSFDELESMAELCEPFKCFIDPDDDLFYSPGNMPEKIIQYCEKTGQPIPEGKGEIVRCIMESLAYKYRMTMEGLEDILGYKIPVLHIVGGGCKNLLLNRFTANALGRPVVTGPVEATAAGNLICQLIALGELSDINEARKLIARSFVPGEYLPSETEEWEDAYGKFRKAIR